ncbi:gramicidin biosynthesis protein, partial [Pedobacter sp. KBW06]|uniref:condensation domain-containing protein n=1 Tax=Pedobacter sp. KBW06 TaxID=2153359 RepID=UPI000F9E1362
SDGWSSEIFQQELLQYYEAFASGNLDFELPQLEIQYRDFAIWQRTHLTEELLNEQIRYWKDQLSGFQTLAIPTDFPRPNAVSYAGADKGFSFSPETSNRLRALVKEQGTTLHTVLLSAFYILLSKYSGQDDITVGSPIANRHHPHTQGLIGFFVNMLVNRAVLDQTATFTDLVQQVHETQVAAQSNQDLPFERLVDEMNITRDISRHPIFQTMFVVQSFGNEQQAKKERERYLKPFQGAVSFQVEKFDLSFFIDDSDQMISGVITYAASLFKGQTIERMARHFVHLTDRLTSEAHKPYSQISLSGPEEFELTVNQWAGTIQTGTVNQTLHALFSSQAAKTPEALAISSAESQYTYRQLDLQSDVMARAIRAKYHQLTAKELSPDTLIPICMDRGTEMIVAILAILKAGGAYVPIDPAYPQHRIDYILADTKAGIIISQQHIPEAYNINLPTEKLLLA